MIKKEDKNAVRRKRHGRIRAKISGTADCPRLNVYRSTSEIYAQIIDDVAGKTLVSCNTMQKEMKAAVAGKTKSEAAKLVGLELGKKASAAGISTVVFDRGGYLYTGRVAQLAEGAREAGLKF